MAGAVLLLAGCSSSPEVTLKEDAETYTLDNGIICARVSKVTGDLVSLRYNGTEMLATTLQPDFIPEPQGDSPADNPNWRNPSISGRAHAYWSHDAMGVRGSAPAIPSVTIDPGRNGGRIAEVSVKAISGGRKMGTGPGAGPDGQFVSDIEIRYTLERGSSGIYTYSIFEHTPQYPLTQLGEARFCAKLAPFFDWMSVDKDRNFHYPKDLHAGDKYIYTALQSANPAFGWSSTTENLGLFFINPSMEYLSGGPTKVEFLGHRDTNEAAAPCILNYWRSSHYGGAELNVAEGEQWTKVVGPFFIYANSGSGPQDIYEDARERAEVEAARWPYDWVEGVDYPKKEDRSAVSGRLVLDDPGAAQEFTNLNVGLTAPAYISPRPAGSPQAVTDWQRDAKFYQFWTVGDSDGSFRIENVRPGKYCLHAFTDGVLGEYVTEVSVGKGEKLDLGTLDWKPLRYGRQLWEIGVPNRNGSEFYMAGEFDDPEISLAYAELFPDDVTFTIGKSDWSRDWFFQHVPHNTDPEAEALPFYGVRSIGRATPYTIVFETDGKAEGQAVLRLAICGTGTRSIGVSVNGRKAGEIDGLQGDGVITRHGRQGIWYERDFRFDASLLEAGTNTLTLTVPEGPVNNGIIYDYIRLELDESGK